MVHIRLLIIALFTALILPSCVSYNEMLFFQDNPKLLVEEKTMTGQRMAYYQNYLFERYKIRPYDNLFIKINTLDNSISTLDFINETQTSGGGLALGPAELHLTSYTVDGGGFVEIPLLGKVSVVGKTINEIKLALSEALQKQMATGENGAAITNFRVKLSNFRVSVLGEVNQPGIKFIFNDKLTLLQALGHGGGLTNYANGKRVKLIRETEKGIESHMIDLTKLDILTSDLYFMLPNDIIYVEPLKAKAFSINGQSVSIVLSAISVTTLVASIIIQLQNGNN